MPPENRRLTSSRSWDNATIDDYVNDVAIVWEPHDKDRSMIDIWLRVVRHSSELGELVRRRRYDDANKQLGRISIWMLTFASKGLRDLSGLDSLFRLSAPLSTILWRKYPSCCAACFTRRVVLAKKRESWEGKVVPCDCIMTLAETEDRNKLLTTKQKQRAKKRRVEYAAYHLARGASDYGKLSLRDLELRFALIFRRNLFALDLEHVTFHFLEEVGEVVEAITDLYTFQTGKDTPPESLKDQWTAGLAELEEELADSFSWLFAVSSKFREVFQVFDSYTKNTITARQMTIASHLKERHMRDRDKLMRCWDCGSAVCTCKIKLIIDGDEAERLVANTGTLSTRQS